VLGCLVGGLVGDALGGPAEGLHYRAVESRFGQITQMLPYGGKPAGSSTDDSLLKHMLCRAIINRGGRVTPDDWAAVWRKEMDVRQFYYPVANAYYKVVYQNVPPREAGRGNMVSNSSAMCISPIGILCAGDPERAAADALDVTQLIHSGPTQEGAMAAAAAVAEAFRPSASAASVYSAALGCLPAGEMRESLEGARRIVEAAPTYPEFRLRYYATSLLPWPRPPDEPEERSTAVDPRESVAVALAVMLLAGGDTRSTIAGCANFGRDADTIATIAGSVVGALNGLTAIPEEWVGPVLSATPVDQEELARQLVEVLRGQLARQADRLAALRDLDLD
jgi:ADP-ribosylglycohydrolase